jgi:hypothetical protein
MANDDDKGAPKAAPAPAPSQTQTSRAAEATKRRDQAAAQAAERDAQRRSEATRLYTAEVERIGELAQTDPAAAAEAMKLLEARQRDLLTASTVDAEPDEDLNADFSETPESAQSEPTQTYIVQDPNMIRQVQGAQARAKAMADRLDYAPNGGIFLRSDGTRINFDGVPVGTDGTPIRG